MKQEKNALCEREKKAQRCFAKPLKGENARSWDDIAGLFIDKANIENYDE